MFSWTQLRYVRCPISVCEVPALVSYWSKDERTGIKRFSPLLVSGSGTRGLKLPVGYYSLALAQANMRIQFFDFLAFLALNVHISLSSQQQCTVDSVCSKLSNILQKQDYLEKKVEEHGQILGDEGCNIGKSIIVFIAMYYTRKYSFLSYW